MTKAAIIRREWRKKNAERDRENNQRAYKKMRKLKPWYNYFSNARSRCKETYDRPNANSYRGKKFSLTEEDVKMMWFRDKAYLMQQPSIDRINNEKDYTIENCRFLELSDNIKRREYIEVKGENNPLHKLKTDEVLIIRDSSETLVALAKRYGVAPKTISRVKTRETWAWL